MAEKLSEVIQGIQGLSVEDSKHTAESLAAKIFAAKTPEDLRMLLLAHADELADSDVYKNPQDRLVTRAIAKRGLELEFKDLNDAIDKIWCIQDLQAFLNDHSSVLNELNIEEPKHKAFAKKITRCILNVKIVGTEDKEYAEHVIRFFNEDNQNLLNAIKKAKSSKAPKAAADEEKSSAELGEIQKLIKKADLSMRDFFGTTLLMHAADTGSVEITRLLLEAGCKQSDEGQDDRYEETVLSYAVRTDNPKLVTLLLTHKNGVQDPSQHFANDVSIVEFAERLGLKDIVSILEEHAPKESSKRSMKR